MKEKIIELRSQGLSYNEISKLLNCSKGTISYHCSKLISNKKIKKDNGFKEVINIKDENLNIDEIKTFYNNNNKSINKTQKEFNISKKRIKVFLNITHFDKICSQCGEIFQTNNNNKMCCSKECRQEYRKKYMKNINYKYDNLVNWRLDIKKKSVEYKGGKCIICGYNKCLRSLDFHHLIPEEKDFSISKNKNRKFENLKNELNKCVLLCSNCHGEIHEGQHKEKLKKYAEA